MRAILKKELKSYFLSPIGYVVIGVFLLSFSTFFYMLFGSIDLGALYYNSALFGFMIIIPILTMRMFAEERKSGTDQLLFTAPVSIFKIVMAKLLAALLVIVVTLIISILYWIIVSFFGKINLITTIIAVLGFLLISIAALSFGMFASSITENQIIAGIITIAFLIISLFAGMIHETLRNIVLIDYYLPLARGIVSIESIISLLLFTLVFISLTIIVLQRRKLLK